MRMFQALEASASALTAERLRMDVIANNLANYRTTRTAEGGPYRRRVVVVQERPNTTNTFAEALAREAGRPAEPGLGVRVREIVEDPSPFKEVLDPTHPDADPVTGIVRLPNVDLLQEITDLMLAQRMYEANLTALNAAKSMAMRALEIGR
mgnify:CR=1 FL=1